MTSFTNAPVYTLYLRDTEGVQNSDHSWSWTVYWNSVFSADSQYDQYNMTHSFLQTTQVLSGVPTQFSVVVAEGLPLVMTSNSKGVVNIINSYTSVTWGIWYSNTLSYEHNNDFWCTFTYFEHSHVKLHPI